MMGVKPERRSQYASAGPATLAPEINTVRCVMSGSPPCCWLRGRQSQDIPSLQRPPRICTFVLHICLAHLYHMCEILTSVSDICTILVTNRDVSASSKSRRIQGQYGARDGKS